MVISLVFSKDWGSYNNLLEVAFQRLHDYKRHASPKNFVFLKKENAFLVNLITENGTQVIFEKVKVLQNLLSPRSFTEVLKFSGLLHFFRQLIPTFGEMATPLTYLTKKSSGAHNWNHSFHRAFDCLNFATIWTLILICPDWKILLEEVLVALCLQSEAS